MSELGFIERFCEKELFGKDSLLDGEAKWLFKTKCLSKQGDEDDQTYFKDIMPTQPNK